MIKVSTKSLTLEQFLQLPETKLSREYFNGIVIQKSMPQGEHSVIHTELASAINLSLKPQKIARSFTELRCTFGGFSLVPDISVFAWNQIPPQDNGKIANIFTENRSMKAPGL